MTTKTKVFYRRLDNTRIINICSMKKGGYSNKSIARTFELDISIIEDVLENYSHILD